MNKYHRSQFLQDLKEQFPELTTEINAQGGSLYFEIGVFRRFCTKCISQDDSNTIEKCYQLAERAYVSGNQALRNAIDVEFVEGLEFVHADKAIAWAWERFPTTLKGLYIAFHGTKGIDK